VELAEIIGLRPVACAGLLLCVTRRCPLSCAHCSTASTLQGEQVDSGALLRFIATCTPRDRPDLIMLTGGEPMLRPGLVTEVSRRARAAGSKVAILTGAFFARGGRFPRAFSDAVTAVDHVSVSVDAYHETAVPRRDVFALLRRLLDRDVAVSLHIVGDGPDDPYVTDLTAVVTATFGAQVPMLVSEVRPLGRAVGWTVAAAVAGEPHLERPEPCALAAWPVVAFDGTVTACCNQDVVDGPGRSRHLRLGHVSTESWSDIRSTSLASPVLRLVRSAGPRYLDPAAPSGPIGAAEYCTSCQSINEAGPGTAARLAFAAGPAGELLDREAGRIQARRGPVDFARRYGCARHADLVAPSGRPV
jgi:pyruvate-formate lyase-activating enzyme